VSDGGQGSDPITTADPQGHAVYRLALGPMTTGRLAPDSTKTTLSSSASGVLLSDLGRQSRWTVQRRMAQSAAWVPWSRRSDGSR